MRAQHRRVGRKEGREGAGASQPLLLINHQKSLPQFMAFDPSSSFALRGRKLSGGGVGGEPRPRGCGGQGREIRGYGTFWSLKACLDLIQ